jgi:hypothetical protein
MKFSPIGLALPLPSNSKTCLERVSKDTPSSLLSLIVSDKGNFFMTLTPGDPGSAKANRGEPKSCLGRVFIYKLVTCYARTELCGHTTTSRVENLASLSSLLAKACPWVIECSITFTILLSNQLIFKRYQGLL